MIVDRVVAIWQSGGWVMLPLFALAVLLYTQAFQLLLSMRRSRLDERTEVHWWDWVREPAKAEGGVAEIIRFTQRDVSSAREIRNRFDEVRQTLVSGVQRRAKFLAVLVAAAPLLGLLGTVLGMLQTFFGISTSGGNETAGVVAAGISEALVTTQTGLTVSLPGLFIVMMVQRRRQKLEAKLARLESLTFSSLRLE